MKDKISNLKNIGITYFESLNADERTSGNLIDLFKLILNIILCGRNT